VAIMISISRIYVGVHYPTDVIAGIVVGIVCSMLASLIMSRLTMFKKKEEHHQ
jgi:undecaprenyl-diphosphatase